MDLLRLTERDTLLLIDFDLLWLIERLRLRDRLGNLLKDRLRLSDFDLLLDIDLLFDCDMERDLLRD